MLAIGSDACGIATPEVLAVRPATIVATQIADRSCMQVEHAQDAIVTVSNDEPVSPAGHSLAMLQTGVGKIAVAPAAFEQPCSDQRSHPLVVAEFKCAHR